MQQGRERVAGKLISSSLFSRFKFIDLRAEAAIAIARGQRSQRDAVEDGRRDPDQTGPHSLRKLDREGHLRLHVGPNSTLPSFPDLPATLVPSRRHVLVGLCWGLAFSGRNYVVRSRGTSVRGASIGAAARVCELGARK